MTGGEGGVEFAPAESTFAQSAHKQVRPACPREVQANGNVVRPRSPRKYPEVFTFIYLLWMNPTDVVGEPLSAFIPISAGTEVRHNIRPGNSVPTWEGLGQHGAGKVTQSPKGNGSLS